MPQCQTGAAARNRFRAAVVLAGILVVAAGVLAGPSEAWKPSHQPRFMELHNGSHTFWNYDGGPNYKVADRDWPITLIFYGNADVNKVKTLLEGANFTRRGGREYEPYQFHLGEGRQRMDSDKGKKNGCRPSRNNEHIRIYGPGSDRFEDSVLNKFVVASTHIDHNDGDCNDGTFPRRFGYSEAAAGRITDYSASQGYYMRRNHYNLYNAEHKKVITRGREAHIWQNDGKATAIKIP